MLRQPALYDDRDATAGDADCASRATAPAAVAVNSGSATFVIQPMDITVCPNASATFGINFIGLSGDAPFSIQWERETSLNSGVFVPLFNGATSAWDGGATGVGGIVSGATTPTLTIAADTANNRNLALPHIRHYRCTVSNACGGVTSDPALLKLWVSCAMADMNGDLVVDNFDIDPFVIALVNPAGYAAMFPDVNPQNADINRDGQVDNFDIDPFVICILAAARRPVTTPRCGKRLCCVRQRPVRMKPFAQCIHAYGTIRHRAAIQCTRKNIANLFRLRL